MEYLQTKYNHYIKYVSENGTDRVQHGLKITTTTNKLSDLMDLKINEEIFDNPIKCHFKYNKLNNNQIKVIFNSKSDTEYRLDIFKIIESNILYNHISFTRNNNIFDKIPISQMQQDEFDIKYEELTNINEIYDVLGRIRYILISLVNENKIDNLFCIGGTQFIKKNNLYRYFLKIVVGEYGFEKRNTEVYKKTGWGFYFKI